MYMTVKCSLTCSFLSMQEDINVVVLDWPSHRTYYASSAAETRPVGKLASLIMKKVVDEGGASYDKIWCVGHSLGSHVCGNAGRNTPQKISRITGELATSISSAELFYFLILDKAKYQ